jgi:VWFA-related protein
MSRTLISVVGACLFAAVISGAQSSDLVELDVVVTDKSGQILSDLRQDEIQVEDDGKKVEVKSFTPVTVAGGRSVVVVLDDAGVPMAGTQPIQNLANILLSGAGPGDLVTVMRLNNDADTFTTTPKDAIDRINSFQAGQIPYDQAETPERMLRLVVKATEHLGKSAHRRRAIVCIGSPGICAIAARASNATRDKYPNWVAAMSALARANTSVYAMIPIRMNFMEGALTDLSGGTAYLAQDDFTQSAAQFWRELGQYYLVGYAPQPSSKDLRKIVVRTTRKGGIVHARGVRGK